MIKKLALAIVVAGALTATVAHAAPRGDDVQAPRGQDVQAPRAQAPHSSARTDCLEVIAG